MKDFHRNDIMMAIILVHTSNLLKEFLYKYCKIVYFSPVIVSFYKRAQILIADIWACFEGKTFGEFLDIDSLTMFADYRCV